VQAIARQVLLGAIAVAALGACAMRRDVEVVQAKSDELAKTVEQQRTDLETLKGDLVATRTRLDSALRANADASSDQLGDRSKLQALGGRLDEVAHAIDELKKEVATTRREMDARLDDLKRTQDVAAPKVPPVSVPPDRQAHYAAMEAAQRAGDANTARTLGREYVTRYPEDDRADDALFLVGEASLKEGRPASALGEYNRLLKQYPKSNQLGPTLLAMGDAYLLLHDCQNARLAFSAAESRFAKDRVGQDAKARLAKIASAPPGTCAPP